MTAMETQEENALGEGNTFEGVAKAITREKVEETFGTAPEEPAPSDPEPPKQKYALSTSWAKGRDFKKPFDYVIENSGQEVRVRRLDMGDMLKLGIAEEMDFMTKALMTSEKQETGGEAVASAIMKASNFERMQTMINKVVLAGLLSPKAHQPPLNDDGETDEEAKKDGVLYIDDIPFADRMEMFSVIFDSDGLATFRSEQTPGLGNVEDVPVVSLPAD